MNTVAIIICEEVRVKLFYNDLFNNSVLLFCDGFPKCNDDRIDCNIRLHLYTYNEVINCQYEKTLVRHYYDDIFECKIHNSKAIYDKGRGVCDISISELDLMGSTGKMNNNIIFFLLTEVLTRILLGRGFCAYHASSISLNGKAIMFIGESMSGKTTLSLLLARKGYNYLGDDRVFIKDGRVYSYPKPLHISHDVRNYFEHDYPKVNKKGKKFVSFSKYITNQDDNKPPDILCIFMIRKRGTKDEKTYVKKMRGPIYGLNSLFYCYDELPQLLDSIIEMDELPIYIINNQYCDKQVDEIHIMIKNMMQDK